MRHEQGWLNLPTAAGGARATRLEEYRRLVRVELPQAAKAGGWSLRLDHCFARVILDALFGGCWYGHLEHGRGRSAESQLDVRQLARAVQIGHRMLTEGDAEVRRLDAQSLAWRGKPPKR